jgi:hypothetical protein
MLFTQLVFQHVLRVRLNTASPSLQDEKVDDDKAGTGTGAATPVSEGGEETLADNTAEVDTVASAVSSATTTQPATPPSPTPSTSAKTNKGKDKKKEANAGAVVNLVTVDVDFVNSAFDLSGRTCFSSPNFERCPICRYHTVSSLVRVGLTFALLYKILGWRYVFNLPFFQSK